MNIKIINSGSSRTVILTNKYAIKIPKIKFGYYGFRSFLNGLIANIQETEFSKLKCKKLCPVFFSIYGGLLVIMPRCKTLNIDDWNNFNYNEFINSNDFIIPTEYKISSFGIYNNEIVAIDYG